jgi:hypothetical protein
MRLIRQVNISYCDCPADRFGSDCSRRVQLSCDINSQTETACPVTLNYTEALQCTSIDPDSETFTIDYNISCSNVDSLVGGIGGFKYIVTSDKVNRVVNSSDSCSSFCLLILLYTFGSESLISTNSLTIRNQFFWAR